MSCPAVNVPVTVWIVRKSTGADPARDAAEIPGLLADANKILWQRGLTLVQSGAVRYLDNDAWLNHTNVLAETNAVMAAMLDSTNSMGNAVELYFVTDVGRRDDCRCAPPEGHRRRGDRRRQGRSLTRCFMTAGLEDIYIADGQGNPLLEPVVEQSIPADWGGGYYNPWVLQHVLIKRLVMRSFLTSQEDAGIDLPSGNVRGWHHGAGGGGTPLILGPAKVGQSSIIRTPGSH
jgi:hypothetical protein